MRGAYPMKRLIPLILAFAFVAGACGGGKSEPEEETTPPISAQTSPAATLPPQTTPQSGASSAPPDEGYGEKLAASAEALLGIPYVFGGADPKGFDNSGFIYYVMRQNGFISFPRLISEQVDWAPAAGYSELTRGSIAYFSSEPNGAPEFGGICIGGGVMIYSPAPGDVVKKAHITDDYWKSRFVTGIVL